MVRIIFVCAMAVILVSCSNPLGNKKKGDSAITEGHDPLGPGNPVIQIPSDAQSTIFAETPKDLNADGTTSNTLTVTIKAADGTGIAGKVVELNSSRGVLDTITNISATTNSSGIATFTVRSNTTGVSTLTASIPADSFTLTQTEKIYFFSSHPYVDLQGLFAQNSLPGQNNPGGTTTWVNEGTGGASLNASLSNFALDNSQSSSRWGGDGTTTVSDADTGQYRLIFDGSNDVVSLGTGLNSNSSLSYDMWVRPAALSPGRVIASNADATKKGLMLRQRWDGRGGLTLSVGESYADIIAKDNPLGYWRLGETSSPFYNSGTLTNINGTVVAGVTYGVGAALSNDGDNAAGFAKPGADNGAITVPDHNNLDGMTAISLEAWVYVTSSCGGGGINCGIISKRVNAGTNEAYILYTSAKKPILRINGNSGTQLDSTATLADNTWYHIVGVFDGSLNNTGVAPSANHRMKIYINGTLTDSRTNTASASVSATASDFAIGHLVGNNASGWSGRIDEVAVYGYALTPTQIANHYNARASHAVHSASLLTTNTWSHIGASFNGATGALNLNVNGNNSSKTYATSTMVNSTSHWTLGASNLSGTPDHFWSGAISEFRAYTSALNSSELNACFNTTSGKYP